jgi:hypothetical protein
MRKRECGHFATLSGGAYSTEIEQRNYEGFSDASCDSTYEFGCNLSRRCQ